MKQIPPPYKAALHKKIKLIEFSEELNELKILTYHPEAEITSNEILESKFYKLMQNVTELDASSLYVPTRVLLLIAKITATLPNLHAIDISDNNLEKGALEVATYLSKSKSIHTINISYNKICELAPAVAHVLATKSSSLKVLDMSVNKAGENLLPITEQLVKSTSLTTIKISNFDPLEKCHEELLIVNAFNNMLEDLYGLYDYMWDENYQTPISKIFGDHNSQVESFREGAYALFVNDDFPKEIVIHIMGYCYFNIMEADV